ncbi:response regulator [Azospirillum griseum]|uniref:Response regulator n=1 Tax=Azospirillum griseum TaxID=2496639 RepID=A0A3S0JKL5_9PROT|nr:response regulator [Azospirillum griseum]RTR22856.1 response regulator [Azospirillum griseum]
MFETHSILVVEDEIIARSVTVRLLRQLGVGTVMEAADGAEALARCDRVAFDAILCDVEMEPLDGLGFLSALRTRSSTPSAETPVVMLTKHNESDIVLAALHAGAAGYLVKPVTPASLADRLTRILGEPSPGEP